MSSDGHVTGVLNPLLKDFYVIAVISNSQRYQNREALYRKFARHMRESGVHFHTVEVAFGERPFAITDHTTPMHLQLRTIEELWHKENMINQGVERLPFDWKYVCWIDADIEFVRKDWAIETLHALQHYEVVQMWGEALDLGPKQESVQHHYSFMRQYVKGEPYRYGNIYGPSNAPHWHPGFAWACTRKAWDATGGLIDYAVLGAGDNHMAHGLVGMIHKSFHPEMQGRYKDELSVWEERALRHLSKDVGYVPGTILHNWHGKKVDRKYWDRWRILIDNKYDPRMDIKRDYQGLYQLETVTPRQISLRDGIRRYMSQRNEDSVDLE